MLVALNRDEPKVKGKSLQQACYLQFELKPYSS